ncbi:MAG: pyridoxamine 5'-phosphate oxidase [Ignavibacteriales bacterium]|nr:pyridoxamine 5'-phosphate oxidase [Ignavibacteriales bacterium]
MNDSLIQLRREYSRRSLNEQDVDPNPFVQFGHWLDEAIRSEMIEPNAMILATASADALPSARVVLLKGFDERGFLFFTNYESRKAEELRKNPQAALLFYWGELGRQVRIEGTVEVASREESREYFRTRPMESRIGAWASKQSSVIPGRAFLEEQVNRVKQQFPDDEVPLPPFWGGFRLKPAAFEFWQGRENRLHDRLRYSPKGGLWVIERLSP